MSFVSKVIIYIWKYLNPISCAKHIGVKIGDNCKLFGSTNWGSEPYLIELGNHVEVSFGVTFITHDGATWVFRDSEKYKGVTRFGRIRVCDNCFIGAKSIILPGVTIGKNSIVAAGAVVAKSIPDGEVWGGVPARFISKTEDFAEKCKIESPQLDAEIWGTKSRKEIIIQLCDEQEKLKKCNE